MGRTMPRPKGRNTISDKGLTNEQVVVVALARLGGSTKLIDTEDIAVTADKIAPGRFRWRKYTQFINNELVHTALRDAKRLSNLVRGAGSEGWQLTSDGLRQVEELERDGLASAQHRRRIDPKEKAWMSREKSRLMGEDAFRKASNGQMDDITRTDAERFFRLDEYVTGEIRSARIQRIVNSFASDPDLQSIVTVVATKAR